MNPYVQYMYSYPHKTAYRRLKGIRLQDYASVLTGSGHGLYLHIPFCQAKCGYCNLFSITGQGSDAMDRYLNTVQRQCRQYEEILAPFQTEFSDLTIGGGTPLLLSEGQLERMFCMLETHFHFSNYRELVIETAPNQTTERKLKILKEAGVTRVSMGVQSFSEEELRTLRRQHGAAQAQKSLEMLKNYDFSCVNVDFIYGIPGQTVRSLLQSLKEAITYEPDEIFLYPLYVKHGVKLERDLQEGMVLEPDRAFREYQEAACFIQEHGFRQDSMRRFVKQKGCRKYSECGFGTSLALGCGGRSYLGNLHFCTPYAITKEECIKQLAEYEETQDFCKISHGILLTEEELKRRYVIRHLLIYPGLALEKYQEHFGSSAKEDFLLLKLWKENGYIEEMDLEGKIYLRLTEKGLGLSDYLGPQLTSSWVKKRMEEWEVTHGQADDTIQG